MLDDLTGEELAEWEGFHYMNPPLNTKSDFYFAAILSTIINIAISIFGEKDAKPMELAEFIPDWAGLEEKLPENSAKKIKEAMMSFAKTHNAVLEKQRKIDSLLQKRTEALKQEKSE